MSMAKVCLLEIRLDKLVRNVTIHFDSKSFFPLLGRRYEFLTPEGFGP